jgi:hypothetical protein
LKVWTFLELRTKVAQDLDTIDEPFVQMDEMIRYCNEAIEEAEAEICKISEDYFLTDPATITLVSGQQEYDLPTDIYINKIRAIVYHNGVIIYPITRMRGVGTFEEEEFIEQFQSLSFNYYYIYRYRIVTPAPNQYKIKLYPPAREDGAFVKIQYLRSAALVPTLQSGASQGAIDATTIDIPEFANFLMAFMKAKIRAKENGGSLLPEDATLVQQQRQMMVDTLTERVPDDDTTINGDLSMYWEHN